MADESRIGNGEVKERVRFVVIPCGVLYVLC